MHRPGAELELVSDPSDWGFFTKPNVAAAAEEFDDLLAVIEREGVRVEFIDIDDTVPPNLYFIRDLGIVTHNGVILANLRANYRQGEQLFLRIAADRLGIPVFGEVRDAFFEGGDFVRISDEVAALGVAKTSYSGFEEVDELVEVTLLPVPHEQGVHLDVLFNMVRDDLALAAADFLPKEFLGFLSTNEIEVVDFSDEYRHRLASDVLLLRGDRVVMSNEARDSIRALEQRGVDVIPITIHELRKGGGGPGCMVLDLFRK